jgi:hypothetical protein
MKKASFAVLGVLGIFLGVIASRTLSFTSRQLNIQPVEKIRLDRDALLQRLSEAIQ